MRLPDLAPMAFGPEGWWKPTLVLVAFVAIAYLLMWRGWKRRAAKHDLPPLVKAPSVNDLPPALLDAGARYFGTTVSGDWLDRVVAQGLGARSSCRIRLSAEGIDVVRMGDSFRIPTSSLQGARHDQGIAGKVVPPHGLLVVTWTHGDYTLDSGFRLTLSSGEATTEAHNAWVRKIGKLAKGFDRLNHREES